MVNHSTKRSTRSEGAGLVIHGAARYDLLVWLFTFGGERRFRETILRLADLRSGETVLDVGCGTGTLAIQAKRAVGRAGAVHGVDASPEMIARAQDKARRARADVNFTQTVAQKLPFADGSVDVVLSTLMLHHLPRKARPEIVREIRRVLKPEGRLLAVDFAKPAPGKRNLMDHFHRHGFIKLGDLIPEMEAADFSIVRSAGVGERNLHYVLAVAGPSAVRAPVHILEHGGAPDHDHEQDGHSHRHMHGRGLILLAGVLAVLALLAMHAGFALSLYRAVSALQVSPLVYAGVAAAALIVVALHLFGGRLIAGLVGTRIQRSDTE